MKNVFRILLITVVVLLPWEHTNAQDQPKSEVAVRGGFGISSLKYDMEVGKQKDGTGPHFGLDYTYFLNRKIGLRTGLELSMYNSKATLNAIAGQFQANDTEEDFELRYTIDNYEEKLSATYLNIPLMVQFQTPLFNNHQYYIAGGGKIGIPMNANVSSSGIGLKAAGYYAQFPALLDDVPAQGFGSFTAKEMDEEFELKTSFMLSAETGIKWNLSTVSLYTGLYVDYGLNNVAKSEQGKQASSFVVYNQNSPTDYVVNSILMTDNSPVGKVDKIKTFAAGLTVRLAFGL